MPPGVTCADTAASAQIGAQLVTSHPLDPMPILMTAQEAAELLRIPRSTVYELARSRRIPFIKVGRRTLFARQTLLEWIAEQTVEPRE